MTALTALHIFCTQFSVVLHQSTVDHVETLTHVLDNPDGNVHLWSYMTISRAAVEAATRFSHLLDADSAPQVRVLRGAAALIGGRMDELVLAGDFVDEDGGAGRKQVVGLLADAERRLEDAGIAFKLGRDGKRVGVIRGSDSASFNINVTEEAKQRMSGTVAPYRLGSAVMHGAWWFLGSSLDWKDGAFRPVPEEENVANAVLLALASLDTIVAACVRDADAAVKFRQKTDQRMRIVLRWVGA